MWKKYTESNDKPQELLLFNFIRRNGNIYDIQFLFLLKTQEYFRIIVTFIFVLTFLEIFKNRGFHLCKI